ncbi:hypothetical protein O0L34_g17005 [Tuta absoluta]|nr:hypothetical protein O0L34_g17005 [Tuta absoluta]
MRPACVDTGSARVSGTTSALCNPGGVRGVSPPPCTRVARNPPAGVPACPRAPAPTRHLPSLSVQRDPPSLRPVSQISKIMFLLKCSVAMDDHGGRLWSCQG